MNADDVNNLGFGSDQPDTLCAVWLKLFIRTEVYKHVDHWAISLSHEIRGHLFHLWPTSPSSVKRSPDDIRPTVFTGLSGSGAAAH